MTSVYSSVVEVRNLTGLSDSDVSSTVISGIIQYATSQVSMDTQIRWVGERAQYISAEKENKIDGCFVGPTWINANGKEDLIKNIVNEKRKVKVMSYNFDKGVIEWVPVVSWFKKKIKERKTVKVVLSSLNCRVKSLRRFFCTCNHLIFTSSGYKRADSLKKGEIVYTYDIEPNKLQKQVLLGTLLGDASIHKGNKKMGVTITHSEKQKEYVELTESVLKGLTSYVRRNSRSNGFGKCDMLYLQTRFLPCFNRLLSICRKDGKKYVTKKWLDKIGNVGLAFWYMDDGSINIRDKGKVKAFVTRKGCQPLVQLATHGFSEEEINVILSWFESKGIHGWKIFDKRVGSFGICFSSSGSKKFYKKIAKYVPRSMRYKIPEKLRCMPIFWDTYAFDEAKTKLIKTRLVNVEIIEQKKLKPRFVYDLETSNHNYFVGNILVHNSNRKFFVNHYPIGDRDNNGLISGADVYCYAIDSAGIRRHIIVSGITGDGPDPASVLGGPLWLTTNEDAPQTNEQLYFDYFSAPVDMETPHRLIVLATTQLAAALCFTRIDVGKVQSFRVGKIAVTRQSDAFNIYRKLYENTLNSIRQEMFKTAEVEYEI